MGEASRTGIRSGVRIPLQLPVHVRWKNAGGYRQVQGTTGSISGNGLFLTVPQRPPRRAPITFKIALPVEVTGVPLELLCQGRVVHCSAQGERLGVGAVIDDYKIQRAG